MVSSSPSSISCSRRGCNLASVPASHVSASVGESLVCACRRLTAPYSHVASVGSPLVCNTYLEGSRGWSQSDILFLLLPLAVGAGSTSSEIAFCVPLGGTSVSSAKNEFVVL
jgi:hypothetical protein